jgi:hypothetical protein
MYFHRLIPEFLEEKSVGYFLNPQSSRKRGNIGEVLLACVAFLFIPLAAFPQTRVSARVDWFGIYSISTKPDPNDPNGRRYISTPVKGESTDRVPGKEGVRFGFTYTLSGQKGGKVTVKHVYRFPGSGMPTPGGARSVLEQVRDDVIAEPVLIGWSFVGAPPENIVVGEWSLEVWQAEQKLVEKKFTVYAP